MTEWKERRIAGEFSLRVHNARKIKMQSGDEFVDLNDVFDIIEAFETGYRDEHRESVPFETYVRRWFPILIMEMVNVRREL